MSTAVKICNVALSHLGLNSISALTDSSKQARECNTLYEYIRDAVLEDHDWGFARKSQTLALLSDAYSGWDYAYAYPSDCIAPRKIYDEYGDYTGTVYDSDTDSYVQTGKVEYEIRTTDDKDQVILLTDKEDAELIYTAKITNPVLFPPLFKRAFSLRLAADLAQPLKADKQLKQLLMQDYQMMIGKAEVSNANLGHKKDRGSGAFVEAR